VSFPIYREGGGAQKRRTYDTEAFTPMFLQPRQKALIYPLKSITITHSIHLTEKTTSSISTSRKDRLTRGVIGGSEASIKQALAKVIYN
jgi:hypothetical protein